MLMNSLKVKKITDEPEEILADAWFREDFNYKRLLSLRAEHTDVQV